MSDLVGTQTVGFPTPRRNFFLNVILNRYVIKIIHREILWDSSVFAYGYFIHVRAVCIRNENKKKETHHVPAGIVGVVIKPVPSYRLSGCSIQGLILMRFKTLTLFPYDNLCYQGLKPDFNKNSTVLKLQKVNKIIRLENSIDFHVFSC